MLLVYATHKNTNTLCDYWKLFLGFVSIAYIEYNEWRNCCRILFLVIGLFGIPSDPNVYVQRQSVSHYFYAQANAVNYNLIFCLHLFICLAVVFFYIFYDHFVGRLNDCFFMFHRIMPLIQKRVYKCIFNRFLTSVYMLEAVMNLISYLRNICRHWLD